ncbi:unnamed protein product, partial [Symbiodinium sp. CCMP2456]
GEIEPPRFHQEEEEDPEKVLTNTANDLVSQGLKDVKIQKIGSFKAPQGMGNMPADLTKSGRELLRGIPLRRTLQHGGKLWRYKPTDLDLLEREKLYSYSQEVPELDMFISHTWSTPGRWKFVSLLLRFGWRPMLTAWAIGTFTTAALCLMGVLPLSYRVDAVVIGDGSPVNVGTWLISAGFVSSMIGLIVSPYLPSRRSDMAFVDCTCVHQVDQVLMQQGINNIGGFLAASKELRVLWSSTYLSRLWCVFELAAYRKVNPTGKITLSPLFIERITLQIFLWLEALTSGFWYSRLVGSGRMELSGFVLFALLVMGCLAIPLIHSLRHSYLSKKILISSLDTFDVRNVECLVDSDRVRIHAAIVSWYGSLDAFSEYVRGPFREDVLGPLRTPGSIPFGYICVLATPLISLCLEGLLALLTNEGVPAQNILAYSLSTVLALPVFWVPALLVLLVFVCERCATRRPSRWQHYLLTMVIVLMAWFTFMLGSLCAIGSSQHSIEMVLVWTAASVLFSCCTWRYCWKWKRVGHADTSE